MPGTVNPVSQARWFKSNLTHQFHVGIAHGVERRLPNPRVEGSSPSAGANSTKEKGNAIMKVVLGGCSCWFSNGGGVKFVSCLQTEKEFKRQGHAKALLKIIRRYAKRRKVVVQLNCAPYGHTTGGCLSFNDTLKMYEKTGFKLVKGQNSLMEYRPRKVA